MDKDTRNTSLIIILVLIVSTISLVAVVSTIWQLIGPGVEALGDLVGFTIKERLIDYNFNIPEIAEAPRPTPSPNPVPNPTPTPTPAPTATLVGRRRLPLRLAPTSPITIGVAVLVPDSYSYNFPIPVDITGNPPPANPKPTPDIEVSNTGFYVQIPKLDMLASIWTGSSSNRDAAATRGLWLHPNSSGVTQGQTVVYCDRQKFLITDERSCHDIHVLELGDEIRMVAGQTNLLYHITSIRILASESPDVFSTIIDSGLLKIVANHPQQSYAQSIVIIAEPVSN